MKSTRMFVGAIVVIAFSVISGIEGFPRPQDLGNEYVEVDGFVFGGAVDNTRPSSTPANQPGVRSTRPTSIQTVTPSVAPTSPSTGAPVTRSASVEECVQNCRFRTTSEYNPVCGTDGIVYNNPGRLLCASFCGRNVSQAYLGPCVSNPRG